MAGGVVLWVIGVDEMGQEVGSSPVTARLVRVSLAVIKPSLRDMGMIRIYMATALVQSSEVSCSVAQATRSHGQGQSYAMGEKRGNCLQSPDNITSTHQPTHHSQDITTTPAGRLKIMHNEWKTKEGS